MWCLRLFNLFCWLLKMKRIKKIPCVSFDVETTGLEPYKGSRIFAYVLTDENGISEIVRTKIGERCPRLQAGLNDISVAYACHNVKFELSLLRVEGYTIPEDKIFHDTMIMAKMWRNLSIDISLDGLSWELCGYPREIDSKIATMAKAYGGYHKIPVHWMNKYQIADGERGMLLYQTFYPIIAANEKLYADYRNEIALASETQYMEQRGFMVDPAACAESIKKCDTMIETARAEVKELTGEYFNLGSDDQVRKILFTIFKFNSSKLTPTKLKSVDKDVLAELRETSPHPILDTIQKYRAATKGRATIRGYLDAADAGGIVHPNIKTIHADTGREACDNPNLQNVPKNKNLKNPWIVGGRECFRADPGKVLLDYDESGIELRLIIERSGCQKMIDLMRAGEHPHIVAAKLFFCDRFQSKKENKELYDTGKNCHFCLCYGGGIDKFAITGNMSIEEALPGFNAYKREFPEIAGLVTAGNEQAKIDGFVVTAFGRKLFLPADQFYAWLNYYIQGTAAGIIKRSQVRIGRWLRKRFPSAGVGLCLTVHDSIMLQFPERLFWDNRIEIHETISTMMTTFSEINVPLEVECKLSNRRWNEGKDYNNGSAYDDFTVKA